MRERKSANNGFLLCRCSEDASKETSRSRAAMTAQGGGGRARRTTMTRMGGEEWVQKEEVFAMEMRYRMDIESESESETERERK
jgi:hypothetical protein